MDAETLELQWQSFDAMLLGGTSQKLRPLSDEVEVWTLLDRRHVVCHLRRTALSCFIFPPCICTRDCTMHTTCLLGLAWDVTGHILLSAPLVLLSRAALHRLGLDDLPYSDLPWIVPGRHAWNGSIGSRRKNRENMIGLSYSSLALRPLGACGAVRICFGDSRKKQLKIIVIRDASYSSFGSERLHVASALFVQTPARGNASHLLPNCNDCEFTAALRP